MTAAGEEISGTLHIIHRKPDSGWGFGNIELDPTAESVRRGLKSVRITGVFPEAVQSGDRITARGSLVDDPRWGRQFKFTVIISEMPKDRLGLIRCLDAFLPNIGQVRGQAIVDKFGESEVTKIIETDPQRLTEIPGITAERATLIQEAFLKYRAEWDANLFFATIGLPAAWAKKLIADLGASSAVDVVREDPYVLDHRIDGFGFKRCEEIAKSMGIKKSDHRRLRAGILHTIREAAREGHCFLPKTRLSAAFYKLLNNPFDEDLADDLVEDGLIIEEHGNYYLPNMHGDERIVANTLAQLCDTPFDIRMNQVSEEDLQTLNEEQQEAVRLALQSRILVLTGGPGTGKTFTLKFILRALAGETTALAAPTGRAAKRIEELTGYKASTIHRLLGYRGDGFDVEQLTEALIVIDESSMLDIWLAARLLERINPLCTQVILIGDVDQLPSVGPGSVLRDILESGSIPSVRLTKIMRQEETNPLVFAAHDVRDGKLPNLDQTKGFVFLPAKIRNMEMLDDLDADDLVQVEHTALINRVSRAVEVILDQGRFAKNDVQVLCPQRIGPIGSEVFNRHLQQVFNPAPPGEGVRGGDDFIFYPGDRVVQMKNNYNPRRPGEMPPKGKSRDMGNGLEPVFNGDLGIIEEVWRGGELCVRFGTQLVGVRGEELFNIQLAYAMTVHKSQGSEYPCVMIPVHPTNTRMLQRNLLYTGITRAKTVCYLVGKKGAVQLAVDNDRIQRRYTSLRERLVNPSEWDTTFPVQVGDADSYT